MTLKVGEIHDAFWGLEIHEIVITRIRLRDDGAAQIDIRVSRGRTLGPKLLWWMFSYPSRFNRGRDVVEAIDEARRFSEEKASDEKRWRTSDSVAVRYK